eukprot:m.26160 g.26160  ORF g.26160 m.26160 type:complete len:1037 (-) comp8802_c0_seq1:186-3296(-)
MESYKVGGLLPLSLARPELVGAAVLTRVASRDQPLATDSCSADASDATAQNVLDWASAEVYDFNQHVAVVFGETKQRVVVFDASVSLRRDIQRVEFTLGNFLAGQECQDELMDMGILSLVLPTRIISMCVRDHVAVVLEASGTITALAQGSDLMWEKDTMACHHLQLAELLAPEASTTTAATTQLSSTATNTPALHSVDNSGTGVITAASVRLDLQQLAVVALSKDTGLQSVYLLPIQINQGTTTTSPSAATTSTTTATTATTASGATPDSSTTLVPVDVVVGTAEQILSGLSSDHHVRFVQTVAVCFMLLTKSMSKQTSSPSTASTANAESSTSSSHRQQRQRQPQTQHSWLLVWFYKLKRLTVWIDGVAPTIIARKLAGLSNSNSAGCCDYYTVRDVILQQLLATRRRPPSRVVACCWEPHPRDCMTVLLSDDRVVRLSVTADSQSTDIKTQLVATLALERGLNTVPTFCVLDQYCILSDEGALRLFLCSTGAHIQTVHTSATNFWLRMPGSFGPSRIGVCAPSLGCLTFQFSSLSNQLEALESPVASSELCAQHGLDALSACLAVNSLAKDSSSPQQNLNELERTALEHTVLAASQNPALLLSAEQDLWKHITHHAQVVEDYLQDIGPDRSWTTRLCRTTPFSAEVEPRLQELSATFQAWRSCLLSHPATSQYGSSRGSSSTGDGELPRSTHPAKAGIVSATRAIVLRLLSEQSQRDKYTDAIRTGLELCVDADPDTTLSALLDFFKIDFAAHTAQSKSSQSQGSTASKSASDDTSQTNPPLLHVTQASLVALESEHHVVLSHTEESTRMLGRRQQPALFEIMCRLLFQRQPQYLVQFINGVVDAKATAWHTAPDYFSFVTRAMECLTATPLQESLNPKEAAMAFADLYCLDPMNPQPEHACRVLTGAGLWGEALNLVASRSEPGLFHVVLEEMIRQGVLAEYIAQLWPHRPKDSSMLSVIAMFKTLMDEHTPRIQPHPFIRSDLDAQRSSPSQTLRVGTMKPLLLQMVQHQDGRRGLARSRLASTTSLSSAS